MIKPHVFMRIINLNESQCKRLFEGWENLADANPSEVPENMPQSQTWTTGEILKNNGEQEPGDPKDSMAKQRQMSPDGPWQRPGRTGGF